MSQTVLLDREIIYPIKKTVLWQCIKFFIYGLILPLAFAPFHLPGLAIISLALFYNELLKTRKSQPILEGLFFGMGFFGLGTSWVFVSIQEYGHLNALVSAFITLLFLFYLSCFPALIALLFRRSNLTKPSLQSALYFSSLWVLAEFCRSNLFSGFPWLLVGFGQFDAPAKHLLPIIGVYGVSFITVFAATLIVHWFNYGSKLRAKSLPAFVIIILSPLLCQSVEWSRTNSTPLSVGIIQANLSMRDKWDEQLFWQLLKHYEDNIFKLLGTKLIVMPESAIPLPSSFIGDILLDLQEKAQKAGSSILLGIPQPTSQHADNYFNALMTLGRAKGVYYKQHLVPFGEYTPSVFQPLLHWLNIPDANLQPGQQQQRLITVQNHPIASLICYELAYGDLLRKQLPRGEWIVSISDDGWFGHSLALYQQLQIAQVRSLQTARYQVVANNDGLSSVIDTHGAIIASLPAYTPGLLRASIYPAIGSTPWLIWGDWPVLFFCIFLSLSLSLYAFRD